MIVRRAVKTIEVLLVGDSIEMEISKYCSNNSKTIAAKKQIITSSVIIDEVFRS